AGLDRASNLAEFQQQVAKIALSFNVIYADQPGNIGYFVAGLNPVRAPGFDLRLPFPGDGSAEWTGQLRSNPSSINPSQGWLANWNNKPSADYDSGDDAAYGKIFRVTEIQERLAAGPVSVETMKDIPKDIARVKSLGREARFLKPHLLAGLDAVPPSHPLGAQARAVVESWDGNAVEDAISSTNLNAGELIFSSWLDRMISDTFADELGDRLSEASSNMLLHALDFAFSGQSGVPPSRDYFNGVNPSVVISGAFDAVVAALAAAQGEDPSAWTGPRGVITFNHPLVGTVGTIPNSNRSTYGQVVVLRTPVISGENIFSLGQSGFIKLVPPFGFELDPHFRDLLPLYRNFDYKPMALSDGL
ncbi:MAG TPA: penicillin acylase family protein, partial [Myxococcaceae bacterium]|nr:penicillin acylase family protein [Myxococcaceae bacterium]